VPRLPEPSQSRQIHEHAGDNTRGSRLTCTACQNPGLLTKCLAAGTLEPKVGFQYAFKKGADSICVGTFEFQIVDDVNTALGFAEQCAGSLAPVSCVREGGH
jgi:hypothetical protein